MLAITKEKLSVIAFYKLFNLILIRLDYKMIENNETEFKREYVEDIKNTVIAFANGNGGTIYIGVEDNGTACGVSNIDEQMLKLTNALRDSIRPDVMMFVDCKNVTLEEKQLICLKVKRGTARPYYLRGKRDPS